MPDYVFSYWNGTTEVEVFQEEATSWDVEWQGVWMVGPSTLCGHSTFVSTINPGPNLYPGSTIYPGGY